MTFEYLLGLATLMGCVYVVVKGLSALTQFLVGRVFPATKEIVIKRLLGEHTGRMQ